VKTKASQFLNSSFTKAIPGFALSLLAGALLGCGGGSGSSNSPAATPVPATHPSFDHVVLVVEENHDYSEVVGNSSMPYFNNLISQYGLATQYFADAHPSLPNYFALTTGKVETLDDNFNGTIDDDNVVRELVKAGKSWKCYAESLPSQGYTGADSGGYLRHHNPFVYFSDVKNDNSQASNIVPFSQFATDLGNNALPQYAFVVPDVANDAHDGSLAQADSWLQSNIAPLIADSSFQSSGLLIITFDEGEQSDLEHGGGQVATVIISTQAKKGFQSKTFYQHESALRLSLEVLGVTNFPGMSASAADMSEFFSGN
jgi:phosphatidylinositol-3-phosphatase